MIYVSAGAVRLLLLRDPREPLRPGLVRRSAVDTPAARCAAIAGLARAQEAHFHASRRTQRPRALHSLRRIRWQRREQQQRAHAEHDCRQPAYDSSLPFHGWNLTLSPALAKRLRAS